MVKKRRILHACLIGLCFIAFSFTILSSAYAQATGGTSATPQGSAPQSNLQTTDGAGGTKGCRDSYPEAKGGALLGVMVPCITRTIEENTENFAAQFIDWMNPLLAIFITLVIVFFGVKVLEGQVPRLKVEAFVLVFKIGLVVTLLELVPGTLIPATYDTMVEGQSIVASAIDSTSLQCPIGNYGDANTPLLWKQMDCVLGKLFGIAIGNRPDGTKGPNMLLMSSAFGMLGGFFFGGSFGVALFMACMGVLVTAILIVLRTAIAFINGFLQASILFILSPIFVPLTLLQPTQEMFQRWYMGILGAIFMPVIVAAYATFALLLYDKVLFAPDSMFQKLFSPQFAAQVQALPRKPCDYHVTGDPHLRTQVQGVTENDLYGSALFKNNIAPILTGANSPCNAFLIPTLDASKIKDKDGNPYPNLQKWFEDMFYDAIKVLVMSLLINAGFKVAMQAATIFAGSSSAVYSVSANLISDRVQRGFSTAGNELKRTFDDGSRGGAEGENFSSRMVKAPGNVMRGFFDGLTKE